MNVPIKLKFITFKHTLKFSASAFTMFYLSRSINFHLFIVNFI